MSHRPVTRLFFSALAFLLIPSPARGAIDAAQFAPRVSYNVGGGTIGLASGDFNGDGRRDLAVGNNNTFQVKVLYGQAGGTFGPSTTLNNSTNTLPVTMTAGDLNADGRSDLIYKDHDFNVAYGQPGNTFSPVSPYIPGGYKYATTDLNGDGRLDIVMSDGSPLAFGVRAYLGQPGGGFTQQVYNIGKVTLGIAAADFNGDGRMDLVTTNDNDTPYTITVMTQLAGGGFSASTLPGGRSESILANDFNHDGRPDIAFSVFGQGAAVKLGLPGGGFSATTFYPTTDSAFDISSGDFNHDGNPDLALVTVNYSAVSLLLGNGNGTFQPFTNLFASANGSASVLAGDYNGDGYDDLAVASASGPNVDIFYQIPEPSTAVGIAFIGVVAMLRRATFR
jgi:hypothetical protein